MKRVNIFVSDKTKELIICMQKELKVEFDSQSISQGFAIGQALKRYFKLREDKKEEEGKIVD